MRGRADDQSPRFHVFGVEDRIRPDHPLRDIQRWVDRLLDGISPAFAEAYRRTGRPSVPPERRLEAQLRMALDSAGGEIFRRRVLLTAHEGAWSPERLAEAIRSPRQPGDAC